MQGFSDIYFYYLTDIQPIKRNLTHLQIKPFSISHTFQANSAHDGR